MRESILTPGPPRKALAPKGCLPESYSVQNLARLCHRYPLLTPTHPTLQWVQTGPLSWMAVPLPLCLILSPSLCEVLKYKRDHVIHLCQRYSEELGHWQPSSPLNASLTRAMSCLVLPLNPGSSSRSCPSRLCGNPSAPKCGSPRREPGPATRELTLASLLLEPLRAGGQLDEGSRALVSMNGKSITDSQQVCGNSLNMNAPLALKHPCQLLA